MQQNELKAIMDTALSSGADFAEIFIEQKESSVVSCEEGKIEKINTGLESGMGIRVIAGNSTSYLHSNDVSLRSGHKMAQLAGQIAKEHAHIGTVQEFYMPNSVVPFEVKVPPEQVDFEEKIALLRIADEEARELLTLMGAPFTR